MGSHMTRSHPIMVAFFYQQVEASKQNYDSKTASLKDYLAEANEQFNNLKQQQTRLISLVNPTPMFQLPTLPLPPHPSTFSVCTFAYSSSPYPNLLPFPNDSPKGPKMPVVSKDPFYP